MLNEISFSYEKMGTKTRFEEEAKSNSEMAYYVQCKLINLHKLIFFEDSLNLHLKCQVPKSKHVVISEGSNKQL